MDKTRYCPTCGEVKSLSDFYVQRRTLASGEVRIYPYRRCKPCWSLYMGRKKAKKDPSGLSYGLAQRLGKEYRLSGADYMRMMREQGEACLLCGAQGKLVVDHDHSCCPDPRPGRPTCGNCVRGLLCASCNHGLGRFRDNPEAMRRAAEYVETHWIRLYPVGAAP